MEDALDQCRDLQLIERTNRLRIHQLLASFVTAQSAEPPGQGTSPDQLRCLQAQAMGVAAMAVAANPADPAGIDRFLTHPLTCLGRELEAVRWQEMIDQLESR